MSIPIIIDCDPGHDDAIALLLALASPEIELLGVTTVAGNTTLPKTTANALRVLEKAGRSDIPVAAGCDRPLVRDLVVAEEVHGTSGLEGPILQQPSVSAVSAHAVDLIHDLVMTSPEPVTLVPTGPLTNVALALALRPEISDRLHQIVLMGGSTGLGNVTPAAEFNIYVDPEAAHRVFTAGIPLTMIGLDVTHQALLDRRHAELLRPTGGCGEFVAELLDFFVARHPRTYVDDGAPIHDAVAVAELVWPDLVESLDLAVQVDLADGPGRGRTLVDRWGVSGALPNTRVGMELDGARFARLLVERIATLP